MQSLKDIKEMLIIMFAGLLLFGFLFFLFASDDPAQKEEIDAWCAEHMPTTPRSECNPPTAW